MVGINYGAPRFLRAVQLVGNAETLYNDDQLPGALLLYVAALEMIGWEVNSSLGIDEFGQRHKLREKHRLRHFSAAALFVADCLLVLGEKVKAEADFKKLTFERRPRPIDQEPGADWAAKATTPFMSMLGAMVSPHFRMEELSQEAPHYTAIINLCAGMNALGSAALGFLDNHRLALIHEDNNFDFIQYNNDGQHTMGRPLNLNVTVKYYMNLLPRIIESARKPEVIKFLSYHLKDMIMSFEAPLREKTYTSKKA